MKHLTYDDISVTLLKATSDPDFIVGKAMAMTMKQDTSALSGSVPYKFLLDAEHTSILEHVSFTFLITNISRSLLAQVTRHRIGSFTSSSQHYQDYRDYPVVMCEDMRGNKEATYAFNNSYERYMNLIDEGISKEEARQVLPNAAAVNLLWSANARSLVNFLRLRLCHRNVLEMQTFASKIYTRCLEHMPNLFTHAGPQCFMDGKCKQGKMTCGTPWIKL